VYTHFKYKFSHFVRFSDIQIISQKFLAINQAVAQLSSFLLWTLHRRAAREAFFGRRPKKAELSSPECGLDTVGVSTALGWTQAARCGLACVLYARQYVRYGKNSQTQAQTTEFSDERKHIHMQYLTVRILKTFLGG